MPRTSTSSRSRRCGPPPTTSRPPCPGWSIVNDEALAKGRAGRRDREPARAVAGARAASGDGSVDLTGRWIEADFDIDGELLTVVSAYVPTGEADTPRQDAKWLFLDAMAVRMAQLESADAVRASSRATSTSATASSTSATGRATSRRRGSSPASGPTSTGSSARRARRVAAVDGSVGLGLGWVDIGRRFHGEIDGPYTWWSSRGKAFDNDTGWRIDYHLATAGAGGSALTDYRVVRAPSWDTRWSDHAPVVVDYTLGALSRPAARRRARHPSPVGL